MIRIYTVKPAQQSPISKGHFCLSPKIKEIPSESRAKKKKYSTINVNTVKPVLRGHLWEKEQVAL
jgi:hypothetical protein